MAVTAQSHRDKAFAELLSRLTGVEGHGNTLETRVKVIEHTLADHGSKLDAIMTAVQHHRSFDPQAVLRFVSSTLTVVAIVAASVVWVASSIHAPDIAVIKYRMGVAEQRADRMSATLITLRATR